ncbi:MAG TPA: DnaJ domain-containing protein [Novosphingobium sp.]|jgi:curved DNA-binding protein|nr:DnaJ domain-containing protein [Novosphingobium sp.]
MNESGFVDHYGILGVSPDCDDKTLEAAYRHLAKRYHPDHSGTADVEQFGRVISAYRALKSAEERGEYNLQYARVTGFVFTDVTAAHDKWGEALTDAAAHEKILSLLYRRRRESTREPGIGHYTLQEELGCSVEAFDFYTWYLKEKGFIQSTPDGALAITIIGVDQVISATRAGTREQLRIAQQTNASGQVG